MSREKLSVFIGEDGQPIRFYTPCRRNAPDHKDIQDPDVVLQCDHGGLENLEEHLEKLGFSSFLPHVGGECPWVNIFSEEIGIIRERKYQGTLRRRVEEVEEELQELYLALGEKAFLLRVAQKKEEKKKRKK